MKVSGIPGEREGAWINRNHKEKKKEKTRNLVISIFG